MIQSNGEYRSQADRIAARFLRNWPKLAAGVDAAFIRDFCDTATAGDLDTVQLDVLADMVQARVFKAWEDPQ
jgi:hypothetical protein